MKRNEKPGLKSLKLFSWMLLAAMLVFTACKDEEDDPTPPSDDEDPNIVELAQETDDLSSLVNAVTSAGLDGTLGDASQDLTVFAPTNDAFQTFLDENGYSGLDDINADTLEMLLNYHVVDGSVMSSDLSNGQVPTLLNGDSIMVEVNGGVTLNGSSSVTTADQEASNGVVHIIDEVLLPPSFTEEQPTIADIVTSNDDYSTLATLLSDFPGVVEDLGGEGPFTVFAPNDAAFEAFFESDNRFSSAGDISASQLETILTYHVIAGSAITSGQLPADGDSPATLQGDPIQINTSDGVVLNGSVNVRTGNAELFDIMAGNGVIHTIDNVLLPPALQQNNLAEVLTNMGSDGGDYSILLDIVTSEGYGDILEAAQSQDGNLTIFAPTDQAFADLLNTLGKNNLEEIPSKLVKTIVQYHILGQEAISGNLESTTYNTLLEGESVEISLNGGVMVDDAMVVLPDSLASNGVIHGIDKVILPDAVSDLLGTVVEPVVTDTAFTTLNAALNEAGLVDDLIGASDVTVFAPTNTAFADFIANSPDFNSAADLLGYDGLANVLLYHVLGAKVESSQLPASDADPVYMSTLSPGPGETTTSLKIGPGAMIGDSVMINTNMVDIMKDNGIVHVIEGVVTPQNVVELAINDGRFTELADALANTNHPDNGNALATVLQGDGPFTVFGPTDAAFQGVTVPSNNDDRADVLLYHVASGNVLSSGLSDGMMVETLTTGSDKTFTVNINGGVSITDNQSNNSNVVITDIQGTNGVIHVIDGVLLP